MQEETNYPVINPPEYNQKGTSGFHYLTQKLDYEQLEIEPPANYYSQHVQNVLSSSRFDFQGSQFCYIYEQQKLLDSNDFHINYSEPNNGKYAVRFKKTRITLLVTNLALSYAFINRGISSASAETIELFRLKPFRFMNVSLVAVSPDTTEDDVCLFREKVIHNKAKIISSFLVDVERPSTIMINEIFLLPGWKLYWFGEFLCDGNLIPTLKKKNLMLTENGYCVMDYYIDTAAEVLYDED